RTGVVARPPDADASDDQLARDLAVLGDQAALQAARLAGPADGGELGVQRRPGRHGDERAERTAGRVAGLGADQVPRGPVDPLHGAVLGDEEQRRRRVPEHRAQQAAFGVVGGRTGIPGVPGRGLSPAEQVDGFFELGERGLEDAAAVGARGPGGLAQGGIPRAEPGDLIGSLGHGSSPPREAWPPEILSPDSLSPDSLRSAIMATSSSRGPKAAIRWLLNASTSAPATSWAAVRSFSRLSSRTIWRSSTRPSVISSRVPPGGSDVLSTCGSCIGSPSSRPPPPT